MLNFFRRQNWAMQIARVTILVTLFLMPLLYWPIFRDPVNTPKQYLLIISIVVLLVALLSKMILDRSVSLIRSIFDWPILAFLVVSLISTVFSEAVPVSWLGQFDSFVLSSLFIFSICLWLFCLFQFLRNGFDWLVSVYALMISSSVSSILFMTGSLGFSSEAGTVNTISNFPSVFGIFLGAMLLLSVGMLILETKKNKLIWIPLSTAVICLLAIVHLGFSIVYILSAVFLVLLCLVNIKKSIINKKALLGGFCIAILFGLLSIFPLPDSFRANVRSELTLGFGSSWSIVQEQIGGSLSGFLIGTGPGTFLYSFSAFRPEEFNSIDIPESVRFAQPYNLVLAILGESGLLGLISIVLIFVLAFGLWLQSMRKDHVFKELRSKLRASIKTGCRGIEVSQYGSLVGVCLLYITAGFYFVFADIALIWLWVTFFSLILFSLKNTYPKLLYRKDYFRLKDDHSLIAVGIVMIISVTLVVFVVLLTRLFAGEYWFTEATKRSRLSSSHSALLSAVAYSEKNGEYQAVLAQSHLQLASEASENGVDAAVAKNISDGIAAAKLAAELAPYDVKSWDALSLLYINAQSLAPNAGEWAKTALETAIEKEPNNALLHWRVATVYEHIGETSEAVKAYQKTIKLKPDYMAAYARLAILLENDENVGGAVTVLEEAIKTGVAPTDLVYNLGRLYFNRGQKEDRQRAKETWTVLVNAVPNYSDALYGLALIAEKEGEIETALNYLNEVRLLNPNNQDIIRKMKSLQQ